MVESAELLLVFRQFRYKAKDKNDGQRDREHVIFDLNNINLHFYTIKQIHTIICANDFFTKDKKSISVSRTHTFINDSILCACVRVRSRAQIQHLKRIDFFDGFCHQLICVNHYHNFFWYVKSVSQAVSRFSIRHNS